MRRWLGALGVGLGLVTLSVGPAAAFSPLDLGASNETADQAAARQLVNGLRGALESGEWGRVAALFPGRPGPAFTFLKQQWHEVRAGRLALEKWVVEFSPYYLAGAGLGGRLRLAAGDAEGSLVEGRFDLTAIRRGQVWLVGEPLPFTSPDAHITRHDIHVDLRGLDRTLVAEDDLTLEATGPDRRLFLELQPGLVVQEVSHRPRANSERRVAVPFRRVGETLYVELVDTPDPQVLTVRYEGGAPTGRRDFMTATSTVLRSEFAWYPRSRGDNSFAIFRVTAMVPPTQAAIAPGVPDGVDRYLDGWAYQWTTTAPIEGVSVFAGPLHRHEGQAQNVRVDAYLPADRGAVAPAVLDECARVLAFYGARFGPFAYGRLSVVASTSPGGYAASGALTLPLAAFEQPEILDRLLAHEIAHNWTDHLAYRGTPGERTFMAEGVASYLDMLYHGDRDGLPVFRRRLIEAQERYDRVVGTVADAALAAALPGEARPVPGEPGLAPLAAWQALAYDKGALVCHMLRRTVGEVAFDQALRALYRDRQGQTVDIAAFRLAFEKASGQHLAGFFDQWLGRSGRPVVALTSLEVKPIAGGRFQLAGRLVQTGSPYHLNIPLVVETDRPPTLFRIAVRGRETPFKVVVKRAPRRVLVDPLRDMLLAPQEPVDIQ